MRYSEIEACRLCGNRNLVPVLDLGIHALSGVFPKTRDESVTKGPLELVKCHGEDVCGLLQLRQSYDPAEMYGDNYGYRSGLNRTMVEHLRTKGLQITHSINIAPEDIVVDIGSNDGTLLKWYPRSFERIGFDPSGEKFRKYYPKDIHLVSDFFSAWAYRDEVGRRKAKVVTSIAMFYDLADPLRFAREVYEILADDGVWLTEQSYAPAMLAKGSYDTICHEHLAYYSAEQLAWIAERTGFRVVEIERNEINGGSFSVILVKDALWHPEVLTVGEPIVLDHCTAFAKKVRHSKDELRLFLDMARADNKFVLGLGASTKGNIILQYCDIKAEVLDVIGDINADKHGCFTPGTNIPIVPEEEVLAARPYYLLVLPYHFRKFFEAEPRYAGRLLAFPLPIPEVVMVK